MSKIFFYLIYCFVVLAEKRASGRWVHSRGCVKSWWPHCGHLSCKLLSFPFLGWVSVLSLYLYSQTGRHSRSTPHSTVAPLNVLSGKCPCLLLSSPPECLLHHRDGDRWSGKVESRKKRGKKKKGTELCFIYRTPIFTKSRDFSVCWNSVNIPNSDPRGVIFKFLVTEPFLKTCNTEA